VCCEPVLKSDPSLATGAEADTEHLHLEPSPRAARDARQFVARQVGDVDGDLASTLAVLTSELVTNAVLHARTALQVGVIKGPDLLVGVGDLDSGHPVRQPHSNTATQGRGLRLVDGLADRWGITTYDGGKTVWFLLRGGAPAAESRRYGAVEGDSSRGGTVRGRARG
jgi:hypothetical protein